VDLDELRAFLAVVETGSVAAAADRLGSPRATLRRRLDALEARTGVPLLVRGPQGATLTPHGRALAKGATPILEEASALIRNVREVGVAPEGLVRLALPAGLPPSAVIAGLAALRARAPGVRLEVSVSSAPISESPEHFDVVVHFGPTPSKARWLTQPLIALRLWALASPHYLASRGSPVHLDDLAGHTLFTWQAPGASASHWPLKSGAELRVAAAAVHSDAHALRHCAAAGLGIALLPDGGLDEPDFPSGALVPVLPESIGREMELSLSVPATLTEIPRIRLFVDAARSLAASLAGAGRI
jgi:DNA-binding transcriptional LysR family regulator